MDSTYIIREKAVRLAVRTGAAPDLDFVWATQRGESRRVCFGSFEPTCGRECRWYERCRVLSAEPIDAAWRPVSDRAGTIANSSKADRLANRWLPPSLRRASASVRRRPSLQSSDGGADIR